MIQRLTSLFALWTVLGTAWAWLVPEHFLWVVDGRFQPFGQSLVSVLLGVIMLGMGITLSLADFRRIAQIPKCVGAGVILQFTLMPLAGILIASGMSLEAGLAVGLILVSCCPGGTASNVVAYLARANLALSVTMTMASTLIAVVATPLLTGWLAGKFVEIDRWSLFVNMVSIVLIPVVAGVALNRYFPRMTGQISKISPLASVIVVVLIVGGIIAASKPLIEQHFGVLLLAVLLLHAFGFALGYLITRWLGFGTGEQRTISIEVGMQNSGLGSSLASTPSFAAQFATPMQAALAPVPSAISAVYHVVIGSFLAAVWRRQPLEMTDE
ncbi:bile acid:Na+ symporter, BASS family [Parasphingorhabdus marina DSM 22363]|uniref:Bile acid:Na+ symporter, BASS family n=1 Tax=Parasphingorhabdus marina DSM 22363 TaxID=1123272 RepID=A0A1N6GSR4_9SPHN|nr:bile acid:sodium symporter family protein [Parasphingorhabdus marina]SIO10604.1 bile acid:Na+ symporter, BASS family [Parasphingorhabdus marina DSM 22363]